MGREIRRVPLGFDWPLNKVWSGFKNPFYELMDRCSACDASGLNPETKRISDDWYDFAGTGRRWATSITQDEVDALVKSGRLLDLTHNWTREGGWQKKDPPYHPTADEVNRWAAGRGLGHDAINQWICVEARAKRLGVYGKCAACDGSGEHWYSEEAKRRAARWKDVPVPTGEAWQMWETVSEGSPITPACTTAEALAEWCAVNAPWNTHMDAAAWLRFINVGWAPSGIADETGFHKGEEAVSQGHGVTAFRA